MSIKRMGVIAIGSNSVRMLTANLDAALSQPVRGREETALFLSMDDKQRFSEAGMDRTAPRRPLSIAVTARTPLPPP